MGNYPLEWLIFLTIGVIVDMYYNNGNSVNLIFSIMACEIYIISKYLRGNFGELERKSLIQLSKEIEYVRYYTSIEKVRFPDLQIQFELRFTDFMLPALTVQPLVENSILLCKNKNIVVLKGEER